MSRCAVCGGGANVGPAVRLLAFVLMAGTTTGCDLDSVLAVELPGQVEATDLEDPELADILVRSVVSELECAWSQYAAGAAHHGDEYMNASGNLWFRNWGQRRIEANDQRFGQGTCDDSYAFYTPLQTTRFQAEDIYDRLTSEGFAGVPELEGNLATVRAYGAFALIALGEGFCEMSVPEEEGTPGPLMGPDEVLRLAETRFTEAISLAEQAGNDDILNMALVGRARARLNLEDFSGVLEDAAQVSEGYLKEATRGEESVRRYNYNYNSTNSQIQARHATIATHFRELTVDDDGRPSQNEGEPDPRVNTFTLGLVGHNSVTEVWHHGKYTSRASPTPIASHKEARLFMAEAYVRTGELEQARDIINARRAELGLPRFERPADEDEMLELVLRERARDLFVEGGHRFNDMLRFRGTEHEIPFLGEPESIHPDGLDTVGAAYGAATCFPLPSVERLGNPNIS